MAKKCVKVSVLGGGSFFVSSIIHGLQSLMTEEKFGVILSLYDINYERVKLMYDYCNTVINYYRLPITVKITEKRKDAIINADIVIISVGLKNIDTVAHSMLEEFGFNKHSVHDGPPSFVTAKLVFPWLKKLATDIKKYCPETLVVNLVNPTDIICDIILSAFNIRVISMCVEIEHLRNHLAYYLDIPVDKIYMEYGGVNHDGWITKFEIDGKNAYSIYRDRILSIVNRNDFHPGLYGFVQIYKLTGYFRSSGYHYWMYNFNNPYDTVENWGKFRRETDGITVIKNAIRNNMPVLIPEKGVHPEKLNIPYPRTGKDIAKIIQSTATGKKNIMPLQVRNTNNAISNFPSDVIVEISVIFNGKNFIPVKIGPIPDWLCSITRLLSIQRKLVTDYIISNDKNILKEAVHVIPNLATAENLIKFVDKLHQMR